MVHSHVLKLKRNQGGQIRLSESQNTTKQKQYIQRLLEFIINSPNSCSLASSANVGAISAAAFCQGGKKNSQRYLCKTCHSNNIDYYKIFLH